MLTPTETSHVALAIVASVRPVGSIQQDVIMPIPNDVWNDLIETEAGELENRGPLATRWGGDDKVQEVIDAGHSKAGSGRVSRTIVVGSYVEHEDTCVAVDITELNAEIARIVESQSTPRAEIDANVADLEGKN